MKKIWLVVALALSVFRAFADGGAIGSLEAFQASIVPQSHEYVWVKFDISPDYYLYKNKITIRTADDSEVKLGNAVLPDPIAITNDMNEQVDVYKNKLEIQVPISEYANGMLHIVVNYQGCKGASLCLPEAKLDETINLTTGEVISNTSGISNVQPEVSSDSVEGYFTGSPIMVVLGFFAIGLLIAFTPCVFPLLPVLFAIVSNKNTSLLRGFALSLSYILGGATLYALAGIGAVLLGTSLSVYLQSAWITYLIAGLFLVFALSMYDLFEIKLPSVIQTKLGAKINSMQGMSLLTTFIIGGLSNLILSPCVTAPLASALLYISSTHNYVLGASSLFALGLGSGVPLLIIALFGKKYLPNSGNWMTFTKRILALVMIAMAGYMLSKVLFDYDDIVLAIVFGVITLTIAKSAHLIINRKWLINAVVAILVICGVFTYKQYAAMKMHVADDGFDKITQVSQLQQHIAEAKLKHKPIILDFYANWCSACREMDLRTFSNKDVQDKLSKYELVRVDATYNSHDIQQMQNQYGVFALPTVLILYPDGAVVDGFQTYGFTKSADFIARLDKFNNSYSNLCSEDKVNNRC